MKILLDAMGGDNAPDANIKGAVKAINQIEAEVVLIGNKDNIIALITTIIIEISIALIMKIKKIKRCMKWQKEQVLMTEI